MPSEVWTPERVAQELLERRRAEGSLYEFVKQAWHINEGARNFVPGWFLDALAEHLEALVRGDIRNLLCNVPPRMFKSGLCSVNLAPWVWIKQPSLQFFYVSYAQELSVRDSVKARRIIESNWYRQRWDHFNITSDQNTKIRFDNDRGGYRLSSSVDAKITGEGGDIVCHEFRTVVETDSGPIPIGAIVERRLPVRVLSYDHRMAELQWANIDGYESNLGRPIIDIQFDGGTVSCTGDHPVWVEGNGYVPAHSVRPGDVVRCHEAPADVRKLSSDLHGLRQGYGPFLFDGMPDGGLEEEKFVCMSAMWSEFLSSAGACGPLNAGPVLFEEMLGGLGTWREESILGRGFTNETMQHLRGGFPMQAGDGASVQDVLCGMPLKESHWSWERAICSWARESPLFSGVGEDASEIDPSSRWLSMPDLHEGEREEGAVRSSHRWRQDQSRGDEFNFSVPDVSWGGSQGIRGRGALEDRVVRKVRRTDRCPGRVYNLNVAKNHNYFADTVLVHNCVDDPNNVRDRSDVMLKSAQEWWEEVMPTRLNDFKTGRRLLVQQRMHERDISGIVLTKDEGEWTKFIVPMEFEPKRRCRTIVLPSTRGKIWQDPRMMEGELLAPERVGPKELKLLKRELGSEYAISGQLQQRPAPVGGGIIKKHWFRLWTAPTPPRCKFTLMSIDTAITDSKSSAYNVATTWGVFDKAPDGVLTTEPNLTQYVPNVILLSMWRLQCGYETTRKMVQRLARDYLDDEWEKPRNSKKPLRPDTILIEAKTTGLTLIQDMRRAGIPVWPYNPDRRGDKMQRVHLCTPTLAAQRVWLPGDPAKDYNEPRAWAEPFLHQCVIFPNGQFRDIVDTMTQAIDHLNSFNWVNTPDDEKYPEPQVEIDAEPEEIPFY